jgi:hypothetical protein
MATPVSRWLDVVVAVVVGPRNVNDEKVDVLGIFPVHASVSTTPVAPATGGPGGPVGPVGPAGSFRPLKSFATKLPSLTLADVTAFDFSCFDPTLPAGSFKAA